MGAFGRESREAERDLQRGKPETPSAPGRQLTPPAGPLEHLGNRALLALLRSGRLQRKPRGSEPGVLPSGEPPSEGPRTRQSLSGLGGGEPLPRDTRTLMESRFGASFESVRVHTGESAASAAEAVSAHAFTVGSEIVFGAQEYSPETTAGQRLIAHELTHVVQQGRGGGEGGSSIDRHATEREADEAAESVTAGGSVRVSESAGLGVQKDGDDDPLPEQNRSYDPTFLSSRLMIANDGGQVTATLSGRTIVTGTAFPETSVGWYAASGVVLLLVDEMAPAVNFTPDAPQIIEEEARGWKFYLRFRVQENVPLIPRAPAPKPHPRPAPQKPKPRPPPAPKKAPTVEPPAPEQPGLEPAPAEPELQPPETKVTAPSRPSSPEELISRHTSFGNLDEEALGAELLELALAGDTATVDAVLDALGSTDRDDVSLVITSRASDRQLEDFARSEEGRKLLLRMYDELTSGYMAEDEAKQAERVMMARARNIDPRKLVEAEQKAMVIPFSGIGLTKFSSASLSVERLSNGKIWVRSHMKPEHWKDARRLPSTAFAVGLGREFDPDEIVGIHLYDEGGKTIYVPAIFLLQLSNQENTKAASMAAEAFATGLTLGIGGGAIAGGEVAAEQTAVRGGVWAARGLKAVRIADWTAMGAGAASTLINDHRGLILKHFGKDGEAFLKAWGTFERVVAVYGLARGAVALGQTAVALRSSLQKWRALQAELKGLAAEEQAALDQIALQTEKALQDLEQAQASRGAAKGTQPPEDPYDVEAWKAYYEQNPHVGRSVGAASVEDPAVKGTSGTPSRVRTDLGGEHDVISTVDPEGSVHVTYGDKSTTINLKDETGNNRKLTRGLGISTEEATQIMQDIREHVGRPRKLLLSFAQGKGDPVEYLRKALRHPEGRWESDAFGKPPGQQTRLDARIGESEMRLSDYALVFEEGAPGQFTPKPSKTATVTEYQYVNPETGKRISGAQVRPQAVVRVESGEIVEIIDHVVPGTPAEARATLIDMFKKQGWKVNLQ